MSLGLVSSLSERPCSSPLNPVNPVNPVFHSALRSVRSSPPPATITTSHPACYSASDEPAAWDGTAPIGEIRGQWFSLVILRISESPWSKTLNWDARKKILSRFVPVLPHFTLTRHKRESVSPLLPLRANVVQKRRLKRRLPFGGCLRKFCT